MWKFLNKDPPYFITFLEESQDHYYIGVTNFQRYWTYFSPRSTFLYELKECNEGLEFDDENELLERGVDMINNPESLKSVCVTQVDNGELLNVTMTKTFEITLRLDLGLLEAGPKSLFEVVVQPLIKTICDLRSSQHELRELLLKKDREIEEYKIEGKAPRRLITTVYDDAAHMMRHTTYEELFSAPEVAGMLTSIANTSISKSNTSLPSASNLNAVIHKTESTAPEYDLRSQDNKKPLTDTDILPKIEKCSQNTLIDELTSIDPTEYKEIELSEFPVASLVKVKNNELSQSPVPKKRPKKQLNY